MGRNADVLDRSNALLVLTFDVIRPIETTWTLSYTIAFLLISSHFPITLIQQLFLLHLSPPTSRSFAPLESFCRA